MPDREKVIERLERVSYYFKSLLAVGWQGDSDIYRELMVSVNMALALLKEQEPLTILSGRFEEIYNYIAECPECGMEWAMWRPDKMRYCPGCGKAVKWKCL